MSKFIPHNLILIILLTMSSLAVDSPPPASTASPSSDVSSIDLSDISGDYPGLLRFNCKCTPPPLYPFAQGRGVFSVSRSGKRFTIYIFSAPKFTGDIQLIREQNNVITAQLIFEKKMPQGYQLPQEFQPITVTITKTKDAAQQNVISITGPNKIFTFKPHSANP